MEGYDLDAIDPTKPETYIHLPKAVVRAAAERRQAARLQGEQRLSVDFAEGRATKVSEAIRLAYPDDDTSGERVGQASRPAPAASP